MNFSVDYTDEPGYGFRILIRKPGIQEKFR
jgi:hypothetical protein